MERNSFGKPTAKPEAQVDNSEAVGRTENDLEKIDNIPVPKRVEILIKEKYNFTSLADFEDLSTSNKEEILIACYLLLGQPRNIHPKDAEHDKNTYREDWDKICAIFGFDEKLMFPNSSHEKYGNEYVQIFKPYEDKYREYYRNEDLHNRGLDVAPDTKKNRLLSALMDHSKMVNYKDWFDLSFEEKKKIMESAGFNIVFDNTVGKAGHIRLGYELLEPGKYRPKNDYDAFKNNIKDAYFRTDTEKLAAEEALYDKEYISNLLMGYSITDMYVLPVTPEEEKMFDSLTSPKFNVEQARQILKDSSMSEELKNQIIQSFEKDDAEKEIGI